MLNVSVVSTLLRRPEMISLVAPSTKAIRRDISEQAIRVDLESVILLCWSRCFILRSEFEFYNNLKLFLYNVFMLKSKVIIKV